MGEVLINSSLRVSTFVPMTRFILFIIYMCDKGASLLYGTSRSFSYSLMNIRNLDELLVRNFLGNKYRNHLAVRRQTLTLQNKTAYHIFFIFSASLKHGGF